MAELISIDEARARVRAAVATLVDFESVDLLDALGRRSAQDHHADTPWPATDRSAMDGYAVRAGATGLSVDTVLEVVGVCLAGHPFAGDVQDGQAIRIMTGAVVPACVDAVVPVEDTSGFVEVGERVVLAKAVTQGANIRPVGSEVAEGALLIAQGRRIGTAEIGSLAVLGIDPVPVFRRPVVAILATGDEVVDIQTQPAAHQVRNSNAWALAAQTRAAGGEPRLLGIAPDTEDGLREYLTKGLEEADILLTIGGVSKGTHDLVHGLLEELAVEKHFHGIKLKPGKPLFFGVRDGGHPGKLQLRRQTFVLGLPGNPASSFTVFDLFVRPLIRMLSGGPFDEDELVAKAAGVPYRKNWREQVIPTSLRTDESGQLIAELGSSKPSGDPFALMHGRAFARVPADQEYAEGSLLRVVHYSDWDPT